MRSLKQESAQCYADAEIIRARGVAEANKIIGDSLKGNEAYLRYRWIEGLQTNQMQTIYVPTWPGFLSWRLANDVPEC